VLEYLYTITPKEHTVELIDERYKKIDFDKQYDVVGISCITYNASRGFKIADEFRKRNILVILGGYFPSALPEEAKKHADSVVVGEADYVWPKVLEDLENNKLKPFYAGAPVPPDSWVIPKREYGKLIRSATSIQISRGCPNGCKYCSIYGYQGGKYRYRPVNEVINEIKSIKTRNLSFVDASLTTNPKYSKELFRKMKGLKKRFSCFGNINILEKDDELLKLSKEAGCYVWIVGLESFNQENMKFLNKKSNKVENYAKAIDKIRIHGLMVWGLFMFGLDSDKPDVFDNTLKAIYDLKIDGASFSLLTPYPGTGIYEEMEKQGRILTKDWSKYTEGNVLVKPRNMTEEELYQGARRMVNHFFSYPSLFRIMLNSKNQDLSTLIHKTLRLFFHSRGFHRMIYNL
jgi:radical SAM superfamily enzyme YgiQ (UPF0313 family)